MKNYLFIYSLILLLTFLFPKISISDSNAPYGINAHIPSSQVLDKVVEAKISWIRVDFNWISIETAQNKFEWGMFDTMVNQALKRGLSIFATLAYTPPWANGGKDHTVPPTNVDDWKDFVFQAVSRYKNKIFYWGMWNEPNLDDFFKGTVEDYIEKILKPGYEAAKSANPNCFVAGPELAHLTSGDKNWKIWMSSIFQAGGTNYIDVVTHHIYKDNIKELFNELEKGKIGDPSVLDILKAFDMDDKPFWLTETGWRTDDPEDGDTPESQAKRYEEFLNEMFYDTREIKISKVFFYEIIDDPTEGVSKFGIVDSSFQNKPAFSVYQSYITQNPDGHTIQDPTPLCGIIYNPHKGGGIFTILFFIAIILKKFNKEMI